MAIGCAGWRRHSAARSAGSICAACRARMPRLIKSAWLAHKVLVFHGQELEEDDLVGFAQRLGEVEVHLRQTRTTGRREVMLVSNKKEDGKPIGRLGNQELNWHMDQIFMAEPTAGTLLYAVEVTPEGGDTWFCDLAGAYDELPAG